MNTHHSHAAAACDLTLFVACYDEEVGIIPTLDTLLSALGEVGCSYDIVVVDDASKDATVRLVREFMAAHPQIPITLIVNEQNQGLANNYAEAAFWGHGKYYRLICGDDVESRETLVSVFKRLGEADILLTYHADSKSRPLTRRIISRSYTCLVNLLSGHKLRYYNGVAVVRRQDVLRWHSNAHGFGFQADLTTRLLDMGATYLEIPVIPKERTAGASKAITFRNACSVAHTLLEIVVRRIARGLYPRLCANLRLGRTVYRSEAAPGQAVDTHPRPGGDADDGGESSEK